MFIKGLSKAEYDRQMEARRNAISINRSHRLKHLPLVEVPDKPEKPLVLIAYDKDGNYQGRICSDKDTEYSKTQGFIMKWEKAI